MSFWAKVQLKPQTSRNREILIPKFMFIFFKIINYQQTIINPRAFR